MKLFIRRYGQGFPVIILHGLLGLSDNWVSFGRRLATDFDVIIPDLRNHGLSPHSPVFNYPALVEDLIEMIDDLDLPECYIIGHSMGGKTAMHLIQEYPERVKKLVIVDIGISSNIKNTEQQEIINAMLSVDFSGVRSRSEVDDMLKPKVKDIRLRQFLLKNVFWNDTGLLGWRINLNVINDSLLQIMEGVGIKHRVTQPVLFIRGGSSEYINNEEIDKIRTFFPGARIETIDNASHWVHADAPEEFYSVVWEFLMRSLPFPYLI